MNKYILLFYFFLLWSCQEDTELFLCGLELENNSAFTPAILTGIDPNKSMCTNGLMVTFSKDPVPFSAPFYYETNVNEWQDTLNYYTFPIYAKVKVKKDNLCNEWSEKNIEILEIQFVSK